MTSVNNKPKVFTQSRLVDATAGNVTIILPQLQFRGRNQAGYDEATYAVTRTDASGNTVTVRVASGWTLNGVDAGTVTLTRGSVTFRMVGYRAWAGSQGSADGVTDLTDLSSGVRASLSLADTAYQKPGTGIPASDTAAAVQAALTAAGTAYQKPGTGIPASDMASAVQTALTEAGTAVQPGDLGTMATETATDYLTAAAATTTYAPLTDSLRWSADPNVWAGDPAQLPLTIATPDGGGHLTHPSVIYFRKGWNGHKYWMAATPYNGTDSSIENPCLYVSDDGDTWAAPAGVTNPIDAAPGSPLFNSDTHLMFLAGTLYLFWRETGGGTETFYFTSSTDGSTWAVPQVSWSVTYGTGGMFSPCFLWDGAQFVCYTVNGSPDPQTIERRTAPAITGPWSAPVTCTVPMPTGKEPWHIDVQYAGNLFVMLIMQQDNPPTGQTGLLRIATSSDGTTFKTSSRSPIPSTGAWHSTHYRSCLVPTVVDGAGAFELFYSGIQNQYGWRVGRTILTARDPRQQYLEQSVLGLIGGAAKIAPYVAADRFNRADGAIGTSDSGHAWTDWAGVANVISNQAGPTSGASKAVIDTGISDGYFEISVMAFTTEAYLIFRGSTTNNYWRWGHASATAMQCQKIVSGSATSMFPTIAIIPKTPIVFPERLGVLCSGSTIRLFRNGDCLAEFVDAAVQTGTYMGFQTPSANLDARFEDMWCRSLIPGDRITPA